MAKVEKVESTFRDGLATIDTKGKRKWIFAKKPGGKLWFWRNVVGAFLLIFFFAAPLIKVKGDPFVLLNFFERKFVLFGIVFWPQDSYIFFLITICLIVFIILFTVIYGRIFCGWVCPQTIFMELIFRRVEYWIDGNFQQQKKLREQSLDAEKFFKRMAKYLVFFAISFVVISTLASYLFGFDKIKTLLLAGPASNARGFIFLMIFSFIYFLIYSWFREQVCTLICPYGRMQGVLLDKKSIVISYDYKRGEPAGRFKKNENRKEAGKGDCVNCRACVQVCPTGIDIRHGTQLECINCTNCIDACNTTMKRFGLPQGLIRYASAESIEKGEKFKWNARIIAYSSVLLVLLSLLAGFIIKRTPLEASILRTPGMLYQQLDSNHYRNLYNLKVINKTREGMPVEIKLLSHEGEVTIASGELNVKADGLTESIVFVELDVNRLEAGKTKLTFGVYSNGRLMQKNHSWFLVPENAVNKVSEQK